MANAGGIEGSRRVPESGFGGGARVDRAGEPELAGPVVGSVIVPAACCVLCLVVLSG